MQYVLVFGRNGGVFTTRLITLHCNENKIVIHGIEISVGFSILSSMPF